MTGAVVLTDVGFDLGDASGKPCAFIQPYQTFAKQVTGDGERIADVKFTG
jgi:hypothetical protein